MLAVCVVLVIIIVSCSDTETTEMTESTRKELEEWFDVYDIDGSGKVDMSELREVIRAYYAWKQADVDDTKIDADTKVRSYLLSYLT